MTLAEPSIGPSILSSTPVSAGESVVKDKDTAIDPKMGPAGSSLDVADIPPSDQISVYTVHAGDTPKKIADMFNVSVSTILAENNLSLGTALVPGTIIYILPIDGQTYLVTKGDTLKSIAKKFSKPGSVISANDIAFNNDIASDDDLSVGDTLIIPEPDFTIAPPTKNNSNNGGNTSKGKTPPSGFSVKGIIISPIPGAILTQGLHFNGESVDIGAPIGTPIEAVANGTVLVTVTATINGYGKYVVLQHNNNGKSYQTLYAHMKKIDVEPGQNVVQGQTLGEVGMTGKTSGPHVHFETRGVPNPFGYPPYYVHSRIY